MDFKQREFDMKKIVKYELLVYDDDERLDDAVNYQIRNKDWQPFGSPFYAKGKFCQAVVKYDD